MIAKLRNKLNTDIHLKEILAGSAVTFVLKMSGMMLGYIVVLIISRQYGAEGIGMYNLTLSIMTFVAMIAAMGMNVSILRYVGQFNKSGEEGKLKLLYRYSVEMVVPFSLILAGILYFFAETIAINVFDNSVYEPALQFAAFIVPFMALQSISVEYIRGLKKLKVSEFLRSVNRPMINIALLFVIGIFVFDQMLPLYTLGVGIIVSTFIGLFYINKKIKYYEINNIYDFSRKELVSTSVPMLVTTIASFIIGNISLVLLEIFSTTEEVGIFSVAFKIATFISLSLVVVNSISAPKFSELYWEKKYIQLQNVINHSSRLIFFSSFAMMIMLIVFNEKVMTLFGPKFVSGNMILIILTIGQMINAATGSVGVFLNMTGYQNVLRNIILFAAGISILLNILLIQSYGMFGAAIATAVGTSILNIVAAIYVKRKLGFTTYFNLKSQTSEG
ncbi:flippase [Sulfurimonas sp. HSL1-6]|uniref:flippase n=1 Tax=Thiomicrolovo immobilis TaxID=3131935 RepID=UPI0031F79313